MKRLIKYNNIFSNDDMSFSDCSTKYEILPYLVGNEAGSKELREFADALGYERLGNVRTLTRNTIYRPSNTITHAVKLNEMKQGLGMYKDEQYQIYLGFITLNDNDKYSSTLKPIESIDNIITPEQANEIICNQMYGAENVASIDGEIYMIMEGHNYYHEIPLLGYSLKEFEKSHNITELTYSDEVVSCHECGEWMFQDDNYNYNYRIVEDCTLLGLECGCYRHYAKNNYVDIINKSDECLELEIAEELEKENKLEFIERFIGDMTDPGRGGYFDGQSIREGQPKNVLEKLLEDNPDNSYLFTHDESGQFQTYFSVWKVVNGKEDKKTA